MAIPPCYQVTKGNGSAYSGEASGELDGMLERTATMQENTLQSKIAAIVGLFEPMMLLLMGVVVLIIVLAIMLPILNMSNLVG